VHIMISVELPTLEQRRRFVMWLLSDLQPTLAQVFRTGCDAVDLLAQLLEALGTDPPDENVLLGLMDTAELRLVTAVVEPRWSIAASHVRLNALMVISCAASAAAEATSVRSAEKAAYYASRAAFYAAFPGTDAPMAMSRARQRQEDQLTKLKASAAP